MQPRPWVLLATMLAGCAADSNSGALAPAAEIAVAGRLATEGPVSVSWTDPKKFSEVTSGLNDYTAMGGDWVRKLAEHLRERAARSLPDGQRFDVVLRDIDRAGSTEPWRGPQMDGTRLMSSLYPPRIELTFTKTGPDGSVISAGRRTLLDQSNLSNAGTTRSYDPLFFEKRLLDSWLDAEIGPSRTTN